MKNFFKRNGLVKIMISVPIILLFIITNYFQIKKNYFPDESKLPLVDKNKLLDLINKKKMFSEELVILNNNTKIGKLVLNISDIKSEVEKSKSEYNPQKKIRTIIFLDNIQNLKTKSESQENLISINSSFIVDKNFTLKKINLNAVYPKKKLSIKSKLIVPKKIDNFFNDEESKYFILTIELDNNEVIRVQSINQLVEKVNTLSVLLKFLNFDVGQNQDLSVENFRKIIQKNNKIFKVNNAKLREGKILFGNIRVNVLILELFFSKSKTEVLRLYFDERGNILKAGPYKNFEIISQTLLPTLKRNIIIK